MVVVRSFCRHLTFQNVLHLAIFVRKCNQNTSFRRDYQPDELYDIAAIRTIHYYWIVSNPYLNADVRRTIFLKAYTCPLCVILGHNPIPIRLLYQKPPKYMIWGALSAWKLGWYVTSRAIHCFWIAAKPCLSVMLKGEAFWGMCRFRMCYIGPYWSGNTTKISYLGGNLSLVNGMICCKENHLLLLNCFKTLLECILW